MTSTPITTISHYPRAKWWAAVGIASVVIGAVLSTAWFVWRLSILDDEVGELRRIPGGAGAVEVVVDDAVDWTVYVEPRGRSLSGVRFEIVDAGSGERVTLASAPNDVGYTVGADSGRPVSRATLEPGAYTVAVSPADVGLAIGDDVGDTVNWMWWGALLIALPTVIGGGTVAGVNIIRYLRAPATRTLPPPSAPPSDLATDRADEAPSGDGSGDDPS